MARKKKSNFDFSLRPETLYSVAAIFLILLGILVIVSFTGQGVVLTAINSYLTVKLGASLLFVPFIFISAGLVMLQSEWKWSGPHVLLGTILLMIATMGLFQQGSIGEETYANLARLIAPYGAVAVFVACYLAGGLILTQLTLPEVIKLSKQAWEKLPKPDLDRFSKDDDIFSEPDFSFDSNDKEEEEDESSKSAFSLPKLSLLQKNNQSDDGDAADAAAAGTALTEAQKDAAAKGEADTDAAGGTISNPLDEDSVINTDADQIMWDYPPLSLLSGKSGGKADRGDVKANAQKIEDTLDSFGINAKVVEVNYGPSVTQYALRISQGTKLSKITNLSTDMALALAAPTGQVRIEAPIAGRSLVGIEVPNHKAQYVTLREMLASDSMKNHDSKLAVSLGIDVSGDKVVADIGAMPHVLIAGATGSGKSVGINSFVSSMLFRASPAEVKFILVDPKRVELTGYNGIPHLLTPVIVDPSKVVSALKWATAEMDRRYKQLAEVGVKNIDGYNELAGFAAMPKIVIVIDELADIMLFAPKEVEESITRIAQMARAVGIHLVLATQRPSVDVITGLIKANIPTRIAFSVSSSTDSRVILDNPGAEKLLGKGDMLYVPPTQSKPIRIQGTYVSDQENKQLIDYIKSQGQKPEYEDEITEKFSSSKTPSVGLEAAQERDELFGDAVTVIARRDKASASLLQRRLSVGYARAARILDQLFDAGLVGPPQGSKPREISPAKIADFLEENQDE